MNRAIESARLQALRTAPPNSWVALTSDETAVVAIGSTYAEAVTKSANSGVKDPVIVKTPASWAPLAVHAIG